MSRDSTASGDYETTANVIALARTIQKRAILVFLIPIFAVGMTAVFFRSESAAIWVGIGIGLPAFIIYMKIRVPTLRFEWQNDVRGALVVLRSFHDERLKSGELVDPGEFSYLFPARDSFIWQAALELWDLARVVLIQEVEETVTPIFGIVVDSSPADWRKDVVRAATGAWAVLIFPATTKGVVEEVSLLCNENLLRKTIFFMPPSENRNSEGQTDGDGLNYKSVWEEIRSALFEHGVNLPEYHEKGALIRLNRDLNVEDYLEFGQGKGCWRKIAELVDPAGDDMLPLHYCIPEHRSREIGM